MIGRAYFNMGEYVKGRRKFEELQTSFPKSKLVNDSHYYISMCHYFSGEEIGAISSLRHLLESEKIKKKRKAELSFFMGEIYFNRKEFGEATTYYEKTLNQYDPDTLSAIARFRIGECLWEKKDYVQAKETFAQVEKSDPSPELLFDSKFKQGECHYILGERQEGMKIYKELSDDNRYKSKLASIKLKIAEGYYALDELSLSMEEYLKVTEDYPRTEESAEAYFELGSIYQEAFGDFQLAKEMYGKCGNENPRSEIAKKALTQSAIISRIEEYQQQISVEETEKSAQPQFLLAELYLTQMNEPDSALMEYLALVDQFPESEYAAKSLYAAAWIYEKVKGDTNQAARTYQRILDEYPQSDYHEIALESLGNSTDSLGLNNAEEIYQKVLKNEITKGEAANLLRELHDSPFFHEIDHIEGKKKIYQITNVLSLDSDYGKKYEDHGVIKEEAKVLGLLDALLGIPFEKLEPEEFLLDKNVQYYSISEEGHIIKLAIGGREGPKLRFFPNEICLLRHLDTLYLEENGLQELPECIGELYSLKELILRYNEIRRLPQSLRELPHLEVLDLQDDRYLFYLYNILDYLDFDELKEEISRTRIEQLMAKKLILLEKAKARPWSFNEKRKIYPPNEILQSEDCEYIILWMLNKNKVCSWLDFEDINFIHKVGASTLAEFTGTLTCKNFIERRNNRDNTYYRITPFGLRRLKKIEEKLKK